MAASGSITWDFDQASQMGVKSSSSSTIVSNLRELLRDPKRLKAVQHVALRGTPQIKHLESSLFTKSLTPDETKTLHTWISEAQIPDTRQDEQDPTSLIIAVLSRLSGLKTLDVQTFDRTAEDEDAQPGPEGDQFTARLLQHLAGPASAPGGPGHALETARVLVPRPEDDPEDEMDYYVCPSSLAPLFSLPRIRRIEAHRVDDGGKPLAAAVATCPTLRELRLVRCQLAEGGLGAVLGAAPGLATLQCDLVLDAEHVSGWYDLGKVRAALDGLKGSLEDLSVRLNLWSSTGIDCGNEGRWGIRGSLGSLGEFGLLTRLAVSLPVLLGWYVQGSPRLADVLPAGLRFLTITNEMYFWWHYEWNGFSWDKRREDETPRWGWIEEKIVEYLESRPGSLEELVLDISTSAWGVRGVQLRDALVSKGQDVGVKVVVHFKPS
ncbi:hypothetical protein KVR01_000365 [Diaporthe batatas]|uniref:uncharacterized protein n=1 Tax=Diaporthe batatas TaxID=748121 RepID=UPI001D04A586|nr:uncharacterized protein KVR01_000365 [Diaporthe batatas]KAG8169620.1 hypothetical protein KVR01_000365 [Diaporthe batatas]